jgi:hypothetical protein
MSWWDSTRLKGRADKVRSMGWINLATTFVVCVVAGEEAALVGGAVWSAVVMGLAYATAHLIDKRAERVIGR